MWNYDIIIKNIKNPCQKKIDAQQYLPDPMSQSTGLTIPRKECPNISQAKPPRNHRNSEGRSRRLGRKLKKLLKALREESGKLVRKLAKLLTKSERVLKLPVEK